MLVTRIIYLLASVYLDLCSIGEQGGTAAIRVTISTIVYCALRSKDVLPK
jgi:hypothetical protein